MALIIFFSYTLLDLKLFISLGLFSILKCTLPIAWKKQKKNSREIGKKLDIDGAFNKALEKFLKKAEKKLAEMQPKEKKKHLNQTLSENSSDTNGDDDDDDDDDDVTSNCMNGDGL